MPNKKAPGMIIYDEHIKMLLSLPDEQAGRLIKAVFGYRETGTIAELESPLEQATLSLILEKVERDTKAYEEACRKKSEAMSREWAKRKDSTL